MKLKFLGTAAAEAAPALFCDCDYCEKARKAGGKNIRTRSQSVINDELLIDFPADTYLHVLHQGLPLHKIYHCIITHSHQDHFYMDLYNNSKILIVVGQGRWEEPLIESTRRLHHVMMEKGIQGRVEYWGHDVDHDWPWWYKMVEHYVPQLLD